MRSARHWAWTLPLPGLNWRPCLAMRGDSQPKAARSLDKNIWPLYSLIHSFIDRVLLNAPCGSGGAMGQGQSSE